MERGAVVLWQSYTHLESSSLPNQKGEAMQLWAETYDGQDNQETEVSIPTRVGVGVSCPSDL